MLVLFITGPNIDKVLEVFGIRGILAGVLFIGFGFVRVGCSLTSGHKYSSDSATATSNRAQRRRDPPIYSSS